MRVRHHQLRKELDVGTAEVYDGDLQMFCEDTPHEVDPNHAAFMRWLVESGRLGRGPSGASSGELVETVQAPDPPLVTGPAPLSSLAQEAR